MTKLRQTIARRLKEAQNTAAMLTTFNDVDMGAVMSLRKQYKDLFEKKHGAKLGFMGFFVKACVQALKEIPAVNAEIDGQDLVYKNYYHVGVAVGTDKGLVVPVVRDADRLSIAGIETAIADLGRRARDGKLSIEEMQGGTFTITNGGIYGSLMSTPILNAPQSGILGMHRIEDRPVVRGGRRRAPDDVPRALLRPPHRRRQGGGDLPGAGQGGARGSGKAGAGFVRRWTVRSLGLVAVAIGCAWPAMTLVVLRLGWSDLTPEKSFGLGSSSGDALLLVSIASVGPKNAHHRHRRRVRIMIHQTICRLIFTRCSRASRRRSIATGHVLHGSLPRAKLKAVERWLDAHRDQVAYIWDEIRAKRYDGGMIE